MSPCLVASDERAFTAAPPLWENALFLARQYGWSPAGTEPPAVPVDGTGSRSARSLRLWERLIDRWDPKEGYTTRVGALVTGPDGRAMGKALAAALDNMPDNTPPTGKKNGRRGDRATFHPKQRFAFARLTETIGQKEKLKSLIAFLLVGDPFRLR